MKERNSNIEILRLIAAFMIFSGHFIKQAGGEYFSDCGAPFLKIFFESGSRISVNIFLLISIWFMLESNLNGRRIFKIYFQTAFYCWVLTILSILLLSSHVVIKDVIRGFIPFWGRALWFVSAYITLSFFAPFLNKILMWRRNELKKLLLLLFFSVLMVSSLPERQDAYLCDAMWFLVVYLFEGYIKKYQVRAFFTCNLMNLIVGMGMYIILLIPICLKNVFETKGLIIALTSLSGQYLGDIKTIPNILIAWFIFVYFKNRQYFFNRWINKIASLAFPIYVFHQVPAFYPVLWSIAMHVHKASVLYVFSLFLVIMVIVGGIEAFRVKFIEPSCLNGKGYIKFLGILDTFFFDL